MRKTNPRTGRVRGFVYKLKMHRTFWTSEQALLVLVAHRFQALAALVLRYLLAPLLFQISHCVSDCPYRPPNATMSAFRHGRKVV
jgi:hypothetical protein